MEINQTESKIIFEANKSISSWFWVRWILVAYAICFFIYFMQTVLNSDSLISVVLLGAVIGPILGYLIKNWKEPGKDVLLVKLLNNIDSPNKSLKQDS